MIGLSGVVMYDRIILPVRVVYTAEHSHGASGGRRAFRGILC